MKPTVLITGVTGHIGFRTLVLALEAGYHARITSRSMQSLEKIKKASSVQKYLSDIEYFAVPDITDAASYDEAMKGVEYVLHIASPIANIVAKPEGVSFITARLARQCADLSPEILGRGVLQAGEAWDAGSAEGGRRSPNREARRRHFHNRRFRSTGRQRRRRP
jgi:uncharacterized protein YbjT (DUF2867 family)